MREITARASSFCTLRAGYRWSPHKVCVGALLLCMSVGVTIVLTILTLSWSEVSLSTFREKSFVFVNVQPYFFFFSVSVAVRLLLFLITQKLQTFFHILLSALRVFLVPLCVCVLVPAAPGSAAQGGGGGGPQPRSLEPPPQVGRVHRHNHITETMIVPRTDTLAPQRN